MDPLQLIRHATMTKTPVIFAEGRYIFGNQKLDQKTETTFKRTHPSE